MKTILKSILFIILISFTCKTQAQVQYNNCLPSGAYASAIGKSNTASGNNSFAGGYNTLASGSNSMAFGYNSKATQSTTIALGNNAMASGIGSLAIGNNVKASAQNSMVFGVGSTSSYPLTNSIENSIAFGSNSDTPTLLITKSLGNDFTGRVAIGQVKAPEAKLHIKSDSNEDANLFIEPSDKSSHKAAILLFDKAHNISVDQTAAMHFSSGESDLIMDADGSMHLHAPKATDLESEKITLFGKVGINTVNQTSNYALAVDGGIITTQVYIKEVKEWPDYVFADEYPLMSLEELKQYLNQHRHLPGVPAEQEILDKGYEMNEMHVTLLQKIEEMTRYILQLHEEIDAMKAQITAKDSIVFTYDSNGNRTSRDLIFERLVDPKAPIGNTSPFLCQLFPNPTPGEFRIQLVNPEAGSCAKATLLTSQGTVLQEKELDNGITTFDLSSHADGVYILKIQDTKAIETWKVIKR